MPKIRQALAVLAAAASCIAFNTYRYPVVREMVAAISVPSPAQDAGKAEKPAAAARPDGVPFSSDAAKFRDRVVCKDGVCSMPLPDSPTASLNTASETKLPEYDPLPGQPSGESREGFTSGLGDRRDSAARETKTARKSKGSAKETPSTAKSSAQSKSKRSSFDGEGATGSDIRSADSAESFGFANSELNTPRDAADPDSTPSNSDPDSLAKGSPASHDPYAASEYGDRYEKPGSESMAADGLAEDDGASRSRERPSSAGSGVSNDSAGKSTAVGVFTSSSGKDQQRSKAASLIPIARPASRTHRSEAAAAKAMAGFQLAGQLGTKPGKVRPLPPVGSDFPVEPPYLAPDVVLTYPVTSAE